MRAQFEGPAAERMAAARARQAEKVAAAGGIEAYRAQAAEQQRRANAQRAVEAARAEVEAQQKRLARAELALRVAELVAEGRWVVVPQNGGPEGYGTPEQAAAGAEWFRAGGIGAHVNRPYCGHGWDDRLTAADSPCRPCIAPRK